LGAHPGLCLRTQKYRVPCTGTVKPIHGGIAGEKKLDMHSCKRAGLHWTDKVPNVEDMSLAQDATKSTVMFWGVPLAAMTLWITIMTWRHPKRTRSTTAFLPRK
jgi:hypothetical protein